MKGEMKMFGLEGVFGICLLVVLAVPALLSFRLKKGRVSIVFLFGYIFYLVAYLSGLERFEGFGAVLMPVVFFPLAIIFYCLGALGWIAEGIKPGK